jgi:hypothetical protein
MFKTVEEFNDLVDPCGGIPSLLEQTLDISLAQKTNVKKKQKKT